MALGWLIASAVRRPAGDYSGLSAYSSGGPGGSEAIRQGEAADDADHPGRARLPEAGLRQRSSELFEQLGKGQSRWRCSSPAPTRASARTCWRRRAGRAVHPPQRRQHRPAARRRPVGGGGDDRVRGRCSCGSRDVILCGHSQAAGRCTGCWSRRRWRSCRAWPAGWSTPRTVAAAGARPRAPDDEQRLERAIEQNVLVQLEHLKTHPAVARRPGGADAAAARLGVPLREGKVDAYDPLNGKLRSERPPRLNDPSGNHGGAEPDGLGDAHLTRVQSPERLRRVLSLPGAAREPAVWQAPPAEAKRASRGPSRPGAPREAEPRPQRVPGGAREPGQPGHAAGPLQTCRHNNQ